TRCAICRPPRRWGAARGWFAPARASAPFRQVACPPAPWSALTWAPWSTNCSPETDMAWIRAIIHQLSRTVTVIPYAIACLVWMPLPISIRYRLTVGWPRLAVWGAKVILGLRWQTKGWENLPDSPAILLSKHQSAWETMFFAGYLPRDVCFVYKRELHRIPFFGWGLALLRMIPIDRSRGREAFDQVIRIGRQRLEEGRWPLLFPEGTRMAPGKTGRYKMGGALLAEATRAPVVPIAHNAGELWPR